MSLCGRKVRMFKRKKKFNVLIKYKFGRIPLVVKLIGKQFE